MDANKKTKETMEDNKGCTAIESSRRFYLDKVAPMLHERFPQYERRIAVGIAGEGSDCFGYDDFVSRDHDFGTGVCLWIPSEDMKEYGNALSDEYERLVDEIGGGGLTVRLRSRRGVMTIHGFYSSILGTEIDTDSRIIEDSVWDRLDHSCLATAVNGEVFRDDLGRFTAFRKLLLDYYPDRIWKARIANELHRFSAAMQVNYVRCMTRGDIVAARMCHMQGLDSAMQLFFLMKRVYPPYYKWTFRRLEEIDTDGIYTNLVRDFSQVNCDIDVWKDVPYRPNILNMSDPAVLLTEKIAGCVVYMMRQHGLTEDLDPYLEKYVDVMCT